MDQLVFFRQFRESLKNLWKSNWIVLFKTIYIHIYVDTDML